jgi:uncharacterized membrane protein
MSIRLYLSLVLAIAYSVLHALPFMPRPDRLFGVAVPREIRSGKEVRQALRRYELQLLPWTALALLASLWLPLPWVVMWVSCGSVIPLIAAGWIFSRRRNDLQHLALPAASTREARLTDDDPLIRLMFLFLVPLSILAGTALYLHAHWDGIPARFPVHWGPGGNPDGWSTRSFAGVYAPLLLGGIIVLFIMGLSALTLWGSRRSARRLATQIVPIAAAYVIATIFSLAGLLPLHTVSPRGVLACGIASLGFLAAMAWLALRRRAAPGAEAGEVTPDACWHGGQFYYNPQDPALFVEKRAGLGLTFNFGNRMSWVVAALTLLIPTGLVFLAFEFAKR